MRASGILLPVFSLPGRYGTGCFSKEAKHFINKLADAGQRYWQILPLGHAGGWFSPYQPLSCFAIDPLYIDLETLEEKGLLDQGDLENMASFALSIEKKAKTVRSAASERKLIEDAAVSERKLIEDAAASERKLTEGSMIDHRKLLPEKMKYLKKAFAAFQKFAVHSIEKDKKKNTLSYSEDNSDRIKNIGVLCSDNSFYSEDHSDRIKDFRAFCSENDSWLDDYAVFISLSERFETTDWSKWDLPFKTRDAVALDHYMHEYENEILFFKWLQYEAHEQWHDLRKYAHERGIDIIGDIPIYAAYESADCWACPELFELAHSLRPKAVSGCPPDAFSPDGQIWGNPLYKWSYHKKTGYRWWIQRLAHTFRFYDVIRLDHFRGFESFFSIPAKDKTTENGQWMKGPGAAFFDAVKRTLPDSRFIAEDLGFITADVQELIEKTGFPGMKVLQFAFDGDSDNPYLTENYTENCVVYSGTHDNDTTAGWYDKLDQDTKKKVTAYLRSRSGTQPYLSTKAPVFEPKAAARSLVAAAMRSKAETCIIPLYDYLLYGSDARINTPGTTGDNWCWRVSEGALSDEMTEYILSLTKGTGRSGRKKNQKSHNEIKRTQKA